MSNRHRCASKGDKRAIVKFYLHSFLKLSLGENWNSESLPTYWVVYADQTLAEIGKSIFVLYEWLGFIRMLYAMFYFEHVNIYFFQRLMPNLVFINRAIDWTLRLCNCLCLRVSGCFWLSFGFCLVLLPFLLLNFLLLF